MATLSTNEKIKERAILVMITPKDSKKPIRQIPLDIPRDTDGEFEPGSLKSMKVPLKRCNLYIPRSTEDYGGLRRMESLTNYTVKVALDKEVLADT